jgi:hypothetical protein
MSEYIAEQVAAPEQAVQESDPLQGQQPGATDTPETVAETDEQKNARELAEREKRSKAASRGIQRRFDELTAARHAAEREKEQLLGLVQSLVGKGTQPQQAPQDANAEPVRGQDEAYEDYVARKAEWRAERKAESLLRQAQEANQRQHAQATVQQAVRALEQDFQSRTDKYAKDNPDFAEVASNEDIEVPDDVGGLVRMPYINGPAVLHAIHRNPALAAELRKYDGNVPALAAVLGRIDAQLKVTPQVSKAAPPGNPVGTRSGSANKDVKAMTPDEYYEHITRKAKK